jgi:hypothetical protein
MSETASDDSKLSKNARPQLWVKDTAGNLSLVSSIAEVPEAQFLEFERGIATQPGNAVSLV